MDPSHIFFLLKIVSGIELSNDLIVPIIFESHCFVHMLLSGIDPLGTARKLPVRKKKSDSY
jgi:hypothetical protein